MSIITQGYNGGSIVLGGYGASAGVLGESEALAVLRLPSRPFVIALTRKAMMYDGTTAREPIVKHPEDVAVYVLGFDDVLPAGETIDEVEVQAIERIAGEGANNLTIEDAAATDNDHETAWGQAVPAGRGVAFTVAGGVSGNAYKATFVVTTLEGSTKGGAVIFELQS
jgi:hypothetical protein